ncbi:hypothetical protein BT63DRAFT_460673 [Microthyrium microscopicum]|uniref:Mid2 domain-containing protein n=1 Tax=Microthyrium microscopicum TaxID=703497 RepID=A0A6A6TX27_9PEZI|nr:hypothetical protein BT63DRAFT_460673 [Microthyrium microscopicum]
MAQLTNPVALPIFFISLTGNCQWGNASLEVGSDFEAKGSLCAYGPTANQVYSCPAGDGICWNTGNQCTGGGDAFPGVNQVACSDIGSGKVHWCCNGQYSSCTQNRLQVNNCWTNFDNPNHNINSIAASSMASVAKQAATAQPTLINVVVTTIVSRGWAVPTISTSVESVSSTVATTASNVNPTTSASSLTTQKSASTSLSGGAIAGIVVTVNIIAIITAVACFFLWRRNRKKNVGTGQMFMPPTSDLRYKFGSSPAPVQYSGLPLELPTQRELTLPELA